MNNKLYSIYFKDLSKPDIDQLERANIISEYMKENNLTQRQFAKEQNIPHSTVQDWLLWNNITKDVYDRNIHDGITHSDIYRMLRNNKKSDNDLRKMSAVDTAILRLNLMLRRISKSQITENTKGLIIKLKNTLNEVEL